MSHRHLLLPGLLAASSAMAADAIDEIVVTTRGETEDLQEVPIAITAITSETLQNAGVRDFQGLTMRTPSFNFNEALSQNDLRITVRGLTNTRGRSNVAFLVDGIDITSETTGTNSGSPLLVNQRLLNDIERVEIVRGPQSALFGRAAFAGAISYVTREPGKEFESRIGLEMSDYGGLETTGTVSLPIVEDTLGLRLNGLLWRDDGAFTNAASGDDVGGGDGKAVAGTLLWKPADGLKLKTRLTWSEDNYDIRPVAVIPEDRITTLTLPEIHPDVTSSIDPTVDLVRDYGDATGLEVRASEDPLTGAAYPGVTLEVFRATLLAEWEIGDYVVNGYTGFTDADLAQRYDLDRQAEGNPDTIFGHNDVDTRDSTRQFSQELRLSTRWDGPVDLTVGGLFWKEERLSLSRNFVVVCSNLDEFEIDTCEEPAAGGTGPYHSWQDIYRDAHAIDPSLRIPTAADTDHWSAYARIDWHPVDTVEVTLEDRWVREEFFGLISTGSTCNNFYPDNGPVGIAPVQPIVGNPNFNFGCGRVPSQSGTETTEYHTPRFIATWRPMEDLMLYASAAKGEKPGGISLVVIPAPLPQPLDAFRFKPEIMWTYELGAKSAWDGGFGRLVVNGAAFLQDYSDKQTATLREVDGFPVAYTSNASSAQVLGVELETQWETPVDGLSATVAYTWLDAEYQDYFVSTTAEASIAIQGNCDQSAPLYADQPDGPFGCLIDNDGQTLEFAPEHALSLQLSYRRPLADTGLNLLLETDGRYQGEVYTSVPNYATQDAYWLWDARAGVQTDRFRLTLFVKNLLDDDTIHNTTGSPDFGAAAVDGGPPIGVRSLSSAVLPQPRTVGVRLSIEF